MIPLAEALNSDLARLGQACRESGIRPLAEYLPQLSAAFAAEFSRALSQAGKRAESTP